jgi:hypothetical protein
MEKTREAKTRLPTLENRSCRQVLALTGANLYLETKIFETLQELIGEILAQNLTMLS